MVTAFAFALALLTVGFIAEELGPMLRRKRLALEKARHHKTIVAVGKQQVRTLGDMMVVLDRIDGAEVRVDFSDGDHAWTAVSDGLLGPYTDRPQTGGPMRRRSRKREQALRDAPAAARVPEPEERRARVGEPDIGLQEFVRRLPCVVCRAPTLGGDPCHRLARRRFGDWVDDLELGVIANIFPACRDHHSEQHDRGVQTFEALHLVDLRAVCRVVGEAYLRGWSADGLASQASSGYETVDPGLVVDGELPY